MFMLLFFILVIVLIGLGVFDSALDLIDDFKIYREKKENDNNV